MSGKSEIINLRRHMQPKLGEAFSALLRAGCRRFDFLGGRRSGKTYFILQYLLGQMAQGAIVSVATMTDTQGRMGAYQDACDIIAGSPDLLCSCTISKGRLYIEHEDGGRMFFKSYLVSERAKGIACDWLYINEANNFTEQQYIDLAASVREGVICDRNPNTECWTERNGFELIHSTWKDNADNLTEQQIAWFEGLKQKAESPNATQADIAFYRMYYLGEYAEISGDIFTPANIIREEIDRTRLRNIAIVADPSNLTGADYFSMVCVGTDGARLYILDAACFNTSNIPAVVTDWDEWCKRWRPILDIWRKWTAEYGAETIFVESNGVGAEFLRYAQSDDWYIVPFINRENKHKRILANYDNFTNRVVWNSTETVSAYLQQVYTYCGKDKEGLHDDNIDCANSALDLFYKQYGWMGN